MMQQERLAHALRSLMQEKRLSQQEIAFHANVSQSTVSRALRGGTKRQGRGTARLFTYMQNEIGHEWALDGKDKVVKAFESVWDGSNEHAAAIAKIIKASEGLGPVER